MLVTRRLKVALETITPAWDGLSQLSAAVFWTLHAAKSSSPASRSPSFVCGGRDFQHIKCLVFPSEIIFSLGDILQASAIYVTFS